MLNNDISTLGQIITTDVLNWLKHFSEWNITENELIEWVTNTIINATDTILWYNVNSKMSFRWLNFDENKELRIITETITKQSLTDFSNWLITSKEIISNVLYLIDKTLKKQEN